MKILSVNAGYFLGYSGKKRDYLSHPVKGLIGSEKEMQKSLEGFEKLLKSEKPDFVLVQEIDGGSLRSRFEDQPEKVSELLPERFEHEFQCKYSGIVSGLPMLRLLGNAVFYSRGKAINHMIDSGAKNLVQEVRVDDLSIFSVHLSRFGESIRRKQLKEISGIAEKRDEFVILGDFNFHGGFREMKADEDLVNGKLSSAGATFPSSDPSKKLDDLIASENVRITNFKKIDEIFSDHQPIVAEAELNT